MSVIMSSSVWRTMPNSASGRPKAIRRLVYTAASRNARQERASEPVAVHMRETLRASAM